MKMKQYTYKFSAKNGLSYTVVASRYDQAKRHFSKVFSGFLCVTYGGRYYGEPVANGKCISIK